MMRNTVGLSLIAAMLVLRPAGLCAQSHPHYTIARTDLRTAQMYMRVPERPNVQLALKPADDEIDAMIAEIDRAAMVDRKDIVDHPILKGSPDLARLEAKDRFLAIIELLRAARTEIESEGANPSARELKDAVLKHIDEVRQAVRRAAVAAHLDREIGSF